MPKAMPDVLSRHRQRETRYAGTTSFARRNPTQNAEELFKLQHVAPWSVRATQGHSGDAVQPTPSVTQTQNTSCEIQKSAEALKLQKNGNLEEVRKDRFLKFSWFQFWAVADSATDLCRRWTVDQSFSEIPAAALAEEMWRRTDSSPRQHSSDIMLLEARAVVKAMGRIAVSRRDSRSFEIT